MTSILATNVSSIPLSQNTAPVYEHRCLYTHDVRRKAKRWQDGILRFHTFNNRVMIYDVPRNFIGDTHYQDGGNEGLADGDELTLERLGVLIQVGERLETQQTDISGIVLKRAPKPIDNDTHNEGTSIHIHRNSNLLQPRSSNILRTPGRYMGWIGRAQVPLESPFAQKQVAIAVEHQAEQGRPAKRQRRDDEHIPLWEILKTTKLSKQVETPAPRQRDSTLSRTLDPRLKASRSVTKGKNNDLDGQGRLKVKEVIDITSSSENLLDRRNQDRYQARPGGVYNASSPARQDMSRVAPLNREQSGLPPRHVEKFVPQEPPIPQPRSPNNAPLQLDQVSKGAELAKGYSNHLEPHEIPTNLDHSIQLSVGTARTPVLPQGIYQSKATKTIPRKSYTADPQLKKLSLPSKSPLIVASSRSVPSSPPVSTTNHLPPNNTNQNAVHIDKGSKEKAGDTLQPKSPIKPLRLNSKSARKMLLCEAVPAVTKAGTLRQQRADTNATADIGLYPAGGSITNMTSPLRKDINSVTRKSIMELENALDSASAYELLDTPSSISCPTTLLNNSDLAIPKRLRRENPVAEPITPCPKPLSPNNADPQQPIPEQQQQRYRTTPRDYSRLDARLLREPVHRATATDTNTSATSPALETITRPSKLYSRAQIPPVQHPKPSITPLQSVNATRTAAPTTIPPRNPINNNTATTATDPASHDTSANATIKTTTIIHRPFRRHVSDTTHLSPIKRNPIIPNSQYTNFQDQNQHVNKTTLSTTTTTAVEPPANNTTITSTTNNNKIKTTNSRKSTSLRRAETISGPSTYTFAKETATTVGGRLFLHKPFEREREQEPEVPKESLDTGPWSREAWDLFGWVPVGKVLSVD